MNKNLTVLKEQIPEGYDVATNVPFVDKQEDFTCPLDCKHKFTIPTNGKGIAKYNEKYTGFEYCTLFEKRLYRTTGGCSTTFQACNCPITPVEIILLEEDIKNTSEKILYMKQQRIKQIKKLNKLNEKRID